MDGRLPNRLRKLRAAIPQVEAVAPGGSRATGQSDAWSDIDLSVYSTERVPTGLSAALVTHPGSRAEIDNRFREPRDEWDGKETGIHVSFIYRDLAATREDLACVLERHQFSIRYKTSI